MSENANLFAQQEANRRRSRWLVVGFILFFAWLGFGGDFIFYEYTRTAPPAAYHHVFPLFGIVLTIIAGGMAWFAWATGPKRVLWSTGARELTAAMRQKRGGDGPMTPDDVDGLGTGGICVQVK